MTNEPVSELDHLKADLAFMIRERDAAVERADELARLLRETGELEKVRPAGTVTRGMIKGAIWQYSTDHQMLNVMADAVWDLLQPDPVDVLADELEHAARDALSATVNLLLTTFGVPVLDVDDLLDEIDWRQVARNHLGGAS